MGIALFIFFSKVFATPNPCLRLASMNTFAMHMRARHAALCSRATASLATSSNRAKTYITKANRRQASQISTPIFTRTLATQTNNTNDEYGGFKAPHVSPWHSRGAWAMGTLFWFWILWRLKHDYKSWLGIEHPWDSHHGSDAHKDGHQKKKKNSPRGKKKKKKKKKK